MFLNIYFNRVLKLKLSELQTKMVINVKDGKHLGIIVDAEMNSDGVINYFVVMPKHFFRRLFRAENDTNVEIKQIIKIGEDVILVDL